MDVWIQMSLFNDPGLRKPATPVLTRSARPPAARRAIRIDHSRVTRDPAIATSHALSAAAASDFRTGLARAFGQLSPEAKEAIRASLYPERPRSAA